jgi:hypothetical protein
MSSMWSWTIGCFISKDAQVDQTAVHVDLIWQVMTCSGMSHHDSGLGTQTQADVIVMLACQSQLCYPNWSWGAHVFL